MRINFEAVVSCCIFAGLSDTLIMDTLPTELRQEILTHLCLASLKALRLTCHYWANDGLEFLISAKFTVKRHRDDCRRLLALSKHEALEKFVESLEFEMGEVDEYHARHNSYFIQYMRDPDERDESSGKAWAEYRYVCSYQVMVCDRGETMTDIIQESQHVERDICSELL